jgi:hypothetical protein
MLGSAPGRTFIEIAPIMRALRAADAFYLMLVHTSQHHDAAMKVFFGELALADRTSAGAAGGKCLESPFMMEPQGSDRCQASLPTCSWAVV